MFSAVSSALLIAIRIIPAVVIAGYVSDKILTKVYNYEKEKQTAKSSSTRT
jgi:hypothetical protein